MAYPFAAAEVLTAANLNAMIGAPPQNAQTGTTYTLALLDAGKTVTLSNASPVTVTVPAQATVTWIANTQINLLNLGAGLVTISPAAGVTINGTPLTLATSKGGTLIRTASDTWTFIPTGSGGKVLQVVRATDTTSRSTTSTSFVDVTGMAVTITPQSATSSVIIEAVFAANLQSTTTGSRTGAYQLTDSSNVAISGAQSIEYGFINSTSGIAYVTYGALSLKALVTPGTTSPVTYKLRFSAVASNVTAFVRNDTSTGQMYAIEVGA